MDFDDRNMTINFTLNYDIASERNIKYVIGDITIALFSIAGIIADILITYIIFHYKRMRTTTNILLANWAISNLFFLLGSPTTYNLIAVIDFDIMPAEFMCFIWEFQEVASNANVLFLTLMSVNWCLGAYWSETQIRISKFYKFVTATIWAAVLAWIIIFTTFCVHEIYIYQRYFVILINLAALFLVLVGLHTIRAVQKCRKKPQRQSNLMLMIPTVLVSMLLVTYGIELSTFRVHTSFIEVIVECFIFCSSGIVLYMLYRYHKGFQACFLQTLNRSNYSDEGFDAAEDLGDSVHINCNSHSEQGLV